MICLASANNSAMCALNSNIKGKIVCIPFLVGDCSVCPNRVTSCNIRMREGQHKWEGKMSNDEFKRTVFFYSIAYLMMNMFA